MPLVPIAYAVHAAGDSPCYGDSAIHISVDDEAGGPFLILKDLRNGSQVSVDFADWPTITEAVELLRLAHDRPAATQPAASEGQG